MQDGASTATTHGARDHARAMAGTVIEAMPTVPATAARDLPTGVAAGAVVWDEVVPAGGYASRVLARSTRLRITDLSGDACAGVLLHRADHPAERLNTVDTVKVQWQAYLGTGSLLLSDMGRVLATIVGDTSGHHDALCGTTTRVANERRYGDGAIEGRSPNGRDLFALALAKHGLERRDVAPNVNLFKGVRVEADGALTFHAADEPRPGTHVELRCELPVLVSLVVVPHPLDPRPTYEVTPVRCTAWRAAPTPLDDPLRNATPEAERAFLNTEELLR